jgi:hypothetical protein
MSVKLICDNKSIDEENLITSTHIEKFGRMWVVADSMGKPLDLKFRVSGCTVKYIPEKYDKITIDVDPSSLIFFRNLETKFNEDVRVEPVVKSGSLGLKTPRDVKENIRKELRKGDNIDVIINFNGVWGVNNKFYMSLELIQFRKNENIKNVERSIDYFESS